jgi:hypothetical protein
MDRKAGGDWRPWMAPVLIAPAPTGALMIV